MSSIKLFQDKKIRSVWDETEQQWYFSVVDVVAALTDSVNPTDYLKKMRKRDASLAAYLGTNCPQVEMMTESGKRRKVLAANIKGLFRIIQSIPSSKAEPFKLWLAQVGYDRIQEIENPELAQERMKELYEQKGYPKDWIDKRLRGIAIRQNLTDEWKERGITEKSDYAILTAEISKATFGLTPSEYKPDTFIENKQVAQRGGNVAGVAREQAEKELGRSIVSNQNFLLGSELDTSEPQLPFDTDDE